MSKPSKPESNPDAAVLPCRTDDAVKIISYVDKNNYDCIREWLGEISDKKARAAIASRITRMGAGNFGDCKPLRDGVWELRIDVGPGYRVYYAKDGLTVVLLLCGGDKRSQNRDIDRACSYWNDWKQRKGKHNERQIIR